MRPRCSPPEHHALADVSMRVTIIVPPALRGKLPRVVQEFSDRRNAFGLCALIFSGVCFGFRGAHNVWMYTIPPLVGPLLTVLFVVLRPFNPYRSIYARAERMWAADTKSHGAESHLVELLRSKRARRVSVRVGLLTAGSLSAVSLCVSLLTQGSLRWSFDFTSVLVATLMCAIVSFGLQVHFLLRWAFGAWAQMGTEFH